MQRHDQLAVMVKKAEWSEKLLLKFLLMQQCISYLEEEIFSEYQITTTTFVRFLLMADFLELTLLIQLRKKRNLCRKLSERTAVCKNIFKNFVPKCRRRRMSMKRYYVLNIKINTNTQSKTLTVFTMICSLLSYCPLNTETCKY